MTEVTTGTSRVSNSQILLIHPFHLSAKLLLQGTWSIRHFVTLSTFKLISQRGVKKTTGSQWFMASLA